MALHAESHVLDAANGVRRAVAVIVALEGGEVAPREVVAIFLEHGQPRPMTVSDAELAELRHVAPRLRAVFAAREIDAAAELINALLAEFAAPPRLNNSDGAGPWHLHAHDDDAPLARWFAASTALALATLLGERQRVPGGLCARPGCGALFAVVGGGVPRRYCSERCATRVRVAAYRSRQATAE
jgi:predicted RNA-binding Zn ribbon-like protein